MIRKSFLASTALLVPAMMTPSERRLGRFLRAPEGHEEGTPAPASSVEQTGGVTRITPDGDPEGQARAEAEAAGGTAPELKEGQPAEPKLPEGYDSWEAYGKAVAEGKVEAPAKEAPKEEKPTEANPALEAKLAPYTAEFTEKGTLSDESVTKAAEEFGVSEEMVRQYLAGGQAEAAATTAPFYEQTGGAEQYAEFQKWAVEGMTADEQAKLNEAYATGGPGALALQQQFVDRWKAEGNGTPAKDLTREGGGKGGSDSAQGYRSMAEQKRDQADPRYDKDPAFRADVERRIAATTAY